MSIIICTYNRAELIGKCLDSLIAQQFTPDAFEVIIVDNNSTDNTKELVAQYQQKMPNLKYIFEENQGLSYARNRGCAEAKAEYLVYLDDDAITPPDYLANISRIIKEHAPDILGGPVYPYYTSKKPGWFKDDYEIRKYADVSGFSTTAAVSGGNYIVKKNVLEKLGMFDVNLGMKGNKVGLGEERKVLELYRSATPKAQQKVYYALECYINHHVPKDKMTFSYIIKRAYIAGAMSQQVITYYYNKRTGVKKTLPFTRRLKNFITVNFSNLWKSGLKDFDLIKVSTYFARYAGIYIGANLEKLRKKRKLS